MRELGEQYEADLIAKVRFRNQESFLFSPPASLCSPCCLNPNLSVVSEYNAPQRLEPTYHQISFPDFEVLKFNYRVIQLNRLNWRDFLNQPNPVASALMAKMNIAFQERPRVKLECLRLLATLRLDPARMKLISGFIDTYLRLNAEEEQLFQADINTIEPSQQEVVMEIVTSWMERGMQ